MQVVTREPDGPDRELRAPVTVVIADDHPVMLIGLHRVLEASDHTRVVGEARSGPELLRLAGRRRPDVVLMDVDLPGLEPGLDGLACIEQIAEASPETKTIVLSASEDLASIDAALRAGASAYIVKSVN